MLMLKLHRRLASASLPVTLPHCPAMSFWLFCICSFWLVMYCMLFRLFCYILPAPSLFQPHSCMFYFISHWSQSCMFSFFSEFTLIGRSLLLIILCSNYTIAQPQPVFWLPFQTVQPCRFDCSAFVHYGWSCIVDIDCAPSILLPSLS